MRVVEHQPPNYDEINDSEPVLFLAGPIQGAANWQRQVLEIVRTIPAQIDTLHVANPRRETIRVMGDFSEEDYNIQVDWEEDHILRSYDNGGILYWFDAQDPDIPYEKGRAYAQTTRIEIGDTLAVKRLGHDINAVFGFDPKYKGGSEKYLRKKANKHGVPVFDELEVACRALVNQIEDQF
jgi:hypothetical protein